jgi:hypothetical protein
MNNYKKGEDTASKLGPSDEIRIYSRFALENGWIELPIEKPTLYSYIN